MSSKTIDKTKTKHWMCWLKQYDCFSGFVVEATCRSCDNEVTIHTKESKEHAITLMEWHASTPCDNCHGSASE